MSVTYYTIDSLLLDNGKSLDPNTYTPTGRIGNELVGFLTAHLGNKSWKVGTTTDLGPHSFLLSLEPNVDLLRFWKAVKFNNWHIRMGCNGTLEVWDHNMIQMVPPANPASLPPLQQSKSSVEEDDIFQRTFKRLNR